MVGPKPGMISRMPATIPRAMLYRMPMALMATAVITPMIVQSTICPRRKAFHVALIRPNSRDASLRYEGGMMLSAAGPKRTASFKR